MNKKFRNIVQNISKKKWTDLRRTQQSSTRLQLEQHQRYIPWGSSEWGRLESSEENKNEETSKKV
jgi:hypothetical protein